MKLPRLTLPVALAAAGAFALALPALADADSLASTGSPSSPFPRNKQNEPTVAVDPLNPSIAVAGSNDEIDLAPCGGSSCPFTPGVGVSGFYISANSGSSWTQPTYSGFSARGGTSGPGPIGTIPNYYQAGLVSDGDPVLVFGPRPDSSGHFSWSNGERLYYGNLTSNFATVRSDQTFKGFEAIAVSHTDNLAGAAAGSNSAWSAPAIVSSAQQNSATFSDKDDIWADNAASSQFFGRVYTCYTDFRSASANEFPEPIMISHSSDGGTTWSNPLQLTQAADNATVGGRQGCAVVSDSHGTVYVFFEGSANHHPVQMLTRSFDGGIKFEKPRAIASVTDIGGDASSNFDGIAGARSDSFPSVSIANGAPSGAGASNTIAIAWSDAAAGLNHEQLLYELSGDGGATWTAPASAAQSGDRPLMPSVALSSSGSDIYFAYDGVLDPYRTDTTSSRQFQGVLRHADVSGTAISGLGTLSRGAIGDGRASSANLLTDEFLGDYNTVVPTTAGALAVYNDARNAAVCPAIDSYRAQLVAGGNPIAPAPGTACPATFGNTDIYAAAVSDPTP